MNGKPRLHPTMNRSAMIDAVYEHLGSLVLWQKADIASYSWSALRSSDPTRPMLDPRSQQASIVQRITKGYQLSPLEKWVNFSDDFGTYALRRKAADDAGTRPLIELLLLGEQLPSREQAVSHAHVQSEALPLGSTIPIPESQPDDGNSDTQQHHARALQVIDLQSQAPDLAKQEHVINDNDISADNDNCADDDEGLDEGAPAPEQLSIPELHRSKDDNQHDARDPSESHAVSEHGGQQLPWRHNIQVDGSPLTEGSQSAVGYEHTEQDLVWLQSDPTLHDEIREAADDPFLYMKGVRGGRATRSTHQAREEQQATTDESKDSHPGCTAVVIMVILTWSFIAAQCE